MIALANEALARNVRVLFVELNPFIRDLPDSDNEHACDTRQTALRHWFKDWHFTLANDFHSAIGLNRLERRGDDDPPLLHERQKFTREEIKVMYPLVLHKPFCGRQFAQVVQAARRRGVTVVLIVPPHSAASEAIQGKARTAKLRLLASQTAADFGVPLFMPQSPWDNAEFYDLAHLNIKGRAHFQAELANWWRRR